MNRKGRLHESTPAAASLGNGVMPLLPGFQDCKSLEAIKDLNCAPRARYFQVPDRDWEWAFGRIKVNGTGMLREIFRLM
jgi:hypothetical protein